MKNALHIHNDIREAAKYFKIPLAMYNNGDVYIMQENRCVFVGKPEIACKWYKLNYGKYCKSIFPIDGKVKKGDKVDVMFLP